MRKTDTAFKKKLLAATDWLMGEFASWNDVQGELQAKGYAHNHYDKDEMRHLRGMYRAIAERFVMEGVDFRAWKWLETPWVGTDGNTGREAYIVAFAPVGETGPGILSFYATRNGYFWYALPLAELPAPGGGLRTFEANCIQDAFDAMSLTRSPEWLEEYSE